MPGMHEVGERYEGDTPVQCALVPYPLCWTIIISMHRHDIPANKMTKRCGKTRGSHGTHGLGALTGRIMVLRALKMTLRQHRVGQVSGAGGGGRGVPSGWQKNCQRSQRSAVYATTFRYLSSYFLPNREYS